jgi:hypothetical protein
MTLLPRILLALIVVGFSLPLRAEVLDLSATVLIYSGSATERRPGATHRTSKAFLIAEHNLATPRLSLLVGDSNARVPFTAKFAGVEVGDPGGFRFAHWRSFVTNSFLSETRLNLTGNYTDGAALLLRPRKLTGHLIDTKFPTWAYASFDPQSTPPQPPDFSDLSLVLTLDVRKTNTFRAIDLSFENILEILKARL